MSEIKRIGKIVDWTVPRLLTRCYLQELSAIIDFKKDNVTKTLYLEKGNVVFARSSLKDERLGEFLIREGLITKEDMQKAANVLVKTGNRIGRILVEMQIINARQLFKSVRKQIAEIVLSIFDWNDGEYRIQQDLKPPEERIILEQTTPELIFNFAKSQTEMENLSWTDYIAKSDLIQIWADVPLLDMELPFEESHRELLSRLTEKKAVADLLHEVSFADRDINRAFCELLIIGFIEVSVSEEVNKSVLKTDVWAWPPQIDTMLTQYNKAFRYIIRYAMQELRTDEKRFIETVFDDVKTYCEPVLSDMQPERDGTFLLEPLKKNCLEIPPERRVDKFIFSLNEYLYGLLYFLQQKIPAVIHQEIIKEIKIIL